MAMSWATTACSTSARAARRAMSGCSRSVTSTPPTAAQMQDQVRLGNTMLYAIDGKRERTYTVPCGDVLAAGGDYLSTSAQAHEELVRYLADNSRLYWTDTFLNIMTYVKKQRGDH
jgi:hypothetical protein